MWRAYFVVIKMRRWPHEYTELPPRERGLVNAIIDEFCERER